MKEKQQWKRRSQPSHMLTKYKEVNVRQRYKENHTQKLQVLTGCSEQMHGRREKQGGEKKVNFQVNIFPRK